MSGKVENILLRIKYYFSAILAQGFIGQVFRTADQAAGSFRMCIKIIYSSEKYLFHDRSVMHKKSYERLHSDRDYILPLCL